MNLTSAEVAGRVRPRQKPTPPSRSHWLGGALAFSPLSRLISECSAEVNPGRCPLSISAGGPVVDVARDLGASAQSIYMWRRQDRIDKGREPGPSSAEKAELTAAKKRIAELETELAIHRQASELIGKVLPPKGGPRPSR